MTIYPIPNQHPHPHLPEWELEDGSYDINQFYCRSTDGHGHKGTAYRVPLMPALAAQAEFWITTQKIPAYRSVPDMLRDALRHRLEWLERNHVNDPAMRAALNLWSKMEETARERSTAEGYLAAIEQFESDCEFFCEVKDWDRLGAALERTADGLEDHPEPYYTRWADVIAKYNKRLPIKKRRF